jgi:hypothetical protein
VRIILICPTLRKKGAPPATIPQLCPLQNRLSQRSARLGRALRPSPSFARVRIGGCANFACPGGWIGPTSLHRPSVGRSGGHWRKKVRPPPQDRRPSRVLMHGGTWFVRAPAGAPELFFVPDRPALGKHRCELELRGRAPLAGERGSRGPLPGPRLHALTQQLTAISTDRHVSIPRPPLPRSKPRPPSSKSAPRFPAS